MGQIITFYAFKGGTGRTMALANTASLVALQEPKKVLIIDWDLEAPGLEHYFSKYCDQNKYQKGLLDFVEKAKRQLPQILREELARGLEEREILESFFIVTDSYLVPVDLPDGRGNLMFFPSGSGGKDYSKRLAKFSWISFFKKFPRFFSLWAEFLSVNFDYVFIDSRTGHTDIGGICTMLMPEKLVLVFTPNAQSLSGVLDLARKAADYRLKSDDIRPLVIYPLPARVDMEEAELRWEWHNRYRIEFEELFREIYALPLGISLEKYFSNVQIRYASRYAYGEEIAVLEEDKGINSISANYRAFVQQLTNLDKIWDYNPFAGIITPHELGIIFSKNDISEVQTFKTHLRPLEKQNVIKWGVENEIPVEEWDNNMHRKIASGSVDAIVLFLTPDLMKCRKDWEDDFREANNKPEKMKPVILPINLKPLLSDSLSSVFHGVSVLPSRNKSLSEWRNQDEAWQKIFTHFRNKLINFNTFEKSTNYGG